jgi:hypothetical protein
MAVKVKDALVTAGAVFVVLVDVWASARPTEKTDSIKTAEIL